MILWNANGTAPTASPVDRLQINTVLGLATNNYNQWVPVYDSNAASGMPLFSLPQSSLVQWDKGLTIIISIASFTQFLWRGIMPGDGQLNSAQLHLNLDHPPTGNGWYSVYVDKISLVPYTATTPSTAAVTSSPSTGAFNAVHDSSGLHLCSEQCVNKPDHNQLEHNAKRQ
jgi:hypothetical protein